MTTATQHRRTSEGQQTVETLFHRAHMVLPYPTTELQLTVQETERQAERNRARQVLAPQTKPQAIQHAQRATGCTQHCNQGRACTCAFGVCDEACSGWAAMAAPRPPATSAAPADPFDLLPDPLPARVFWARSLVATVVVGWSVGLVLFFTR